MSKLHTYLASGGKHTSTSGFVNYIGGASQDKFQATLEEIFAKHPNAVVLNGDDDWYASQCCRPELFPRKFDIQPLAYFHSGISGISKSGIVVSRRDFDKIEREFPSRTFTQIRMPDLTGCALRDCVRVYERDQD